MLTHSDHTLELNSVSSLHAAESFVGEYLDQLPSGIALYQLSIRLDLCGVRVELISRIGGNTAIGGNLRPLIRFLGYWRNKLSLRHRISSFPWARFALHFGANLFCRQHRLYPQDLTSPAEIEEKSF